MARTHRWTIPAISGALIIASLIAAQVAPLVAGVPVLRGAYRALRVRTIGIDLLVSVAMIGALIIGEY